jgi:hypothetical protein
MWRWFRGLFSLAGGPPSRPAAETVPRVGFDADAVRSRNAGGSEDALRWEDLGSITIVTTDAGPFCVDLHWALASRDGRQVLSVPLGAMGEQELLHELQRRLPDFDNEMVIRATASTNSAIFVVWRWRPAPTEQKPV